MKAQALSQRVYARLFALTGVGLCTLACGSNGPDNAPSTGSTHADGGAGGTVSTPAEAGYADSGGAPGAGGDAGAIAPDGADSATPPVDGGGGPAPATATLRTLLTLQYLSAASTGALTAGSDSAGSLETFTLVDLNGGALDDGDEIQLASPNGQYVSAEDSGGSALGANATTAGDAETFAILRLDGPGEVSSGDRIALKTKLKDNYISAIDGGGGEVRADAPWAREWETFAIYMNGDTPPSALEARQRVLDYFTSISGKRTVAGQHNKFNTEPSTHSDWIRAHAGKYAGLWSADFGFGQDSVGNRQKMIQEAKRQWGQGAIVQMLYHNCIPTRNELCSWDEIGGSNPQHLSDDDWNALITDGTSLNAAWKARLDGLSMFFAELETAGVAPLFRPLHEMNQGVFWWGGRGGPNGTRRLFQLTHDYLVHTKGFDNIIWVWDVQDFGSLSSDVSDYDPGQDYYDIAALDVYDGGYAQWKYDAMRGAAGSKPIALGECAVVPSAAELAQQPEWVFFMLWPDFLQDNENAGRLVPLYEAPNVITRDQMPGWR